MRGTERMTVQIDGKTYEVKELTIPEFSIINGMKYPMQKSTEKNAYVEVDGRQYLRKAVEMYRKGNLYCNKPFECGGRCGVGIGKVPLDCINVELEYAGHLYCGCICKDKQMSIFEMLQGEQKC